MGYLSIGRKERTPEWYAEDFVKQLQLENKVEQKCEWSCLLWSKDYWADKARRSQIGFQQTKERNTKSPGNDANLEAVFSDSQFLNTVAQVYSKLFGAVEDFCSLKKFGNCPFMGERQRLLEKGTLASVFVTILHKAVSYSMLDQHPLDSGLLRDEYDAYGIDLTNFQDLDESLKDGRFSILYENVVKRGRELAGIPKPIA